MHAAQAVRQDHAAEEVTQLAHNEARQAGASVVVGDAGEEGLQVRGENLVRNGALGLAAAPDAGEGCHTTRLASRSVSSKAADSRMSPEHVPRQPLPP